MENQMLDTLDNIREIESSLSKAEAQGKIPHWTEAQEYWKEMEYILLRNRTILNLLINQSKNEEN